MKEGVLGFWVWKNKKSLAALENSKVVKRLDAKIDIGRLFIKVRN